MPVVKIVPMPGPSGDGAGFNFRGEWVTDTLYLKNDVVTQNGSSYIANYDYQSAQGPDQDGDLWAPLALKGEDGTGSNSDIADFVFTTVEDPDYESTMSVTNNDMVLKTVVNTEASGNIRIESAQNIVLNADGDAYIGDNSSENNRVATIGDVQAASTADFIFTAEEGQSIISLPGDKQLRIQSGEDSDLYLTAGDDLYIQTLGYGDDIWVQAADDIRFTAGRENIEEEGGRSYGWSMNSEGEFHLPENGYISNPYATVVTSGNRAATYTDSYLNDQSGIINQNAVFLPVDADSLWFADNFYSGNLTSPVTITFADTTTTTLVAVYDATSQGTPAVIFQWNDMDRTKTFEETYPLNVSADYTTTAYEGSPTIVLDPGDYGNDQKLVVDVTAPNHVHLRAGGAIDQSTADIILGGEDTHVSVSDGYNAVNILADTINIGSNAVPSSLNINTYSGAIINSARTSSYSDEDRTVATLGDLAVLATEDYVDNAIEAIPSPDLSEKADLDEDGFLPDSIIRFPSVPSTVAVAVGDNATTYSLNSIDWVASSMPSGSWSSVALGDGKFVAVASGSTAAYSNDGINWREVQLPESNSWVSVTYGDGKFVAVASGTNKAAYSLDGITWLESVVPWATYSSVTYGDGRFIAVASCCITRAIFSLDGISWSSFSIPHSSGTVSWSTVEYANGNFFALSSNVNQASFSSDGISWTQFLPPSLFGGEGAMTKVAYGNGIYVMVSTGSSSGSVFGSSTNGTSWSRNQVISGFFATSIYYVADRFIAVSSNGSLAYSTNGTSWAVDSLPGNSSWQDIVYGTSQIRPSLEEKLAEYGVPVDTPFIVEGGTLPGGTQPTFNGAPLFSGSYVKHGDLVYFRINVDFSNIVSFGTGQYYVKLPFVSKYGTNVRGGCLHDTSNGNEWDISGHVFADSDVLHLHYTSGTGQDEPFDYNSPINLTTQDIFHVSGSYIV